ncbi:MAG: peptidoglycan-binding domain-containing protein [Paracoccaceae bacterium]|nr:peptidoglycan-binding domain-containing protein [Paracoccaceae bacterium]
MNFPSRYRALAGMILLAGCSGMQISGITDMSASLTEQEVIVAPPWAKPGECYKKTTSPALIETITKHILVRAPSYDTDGKLKQPAAYRTETSQQILRERQAEWIRIPCRKDMVEDFTASLQRALQVRGLYKGPINGLYDKHTQKAVRRFQRAMGMDTDILSLAAARKLGLVAYDRDQLTAQSK